MEVRCAGCNKLFRVSDEKIVGSGIKFSCTRCKETVKITKEEFEQYKMANEANLLLASAAPKPLKAAAAPSVVEAAIAPPAPEPSGAAPEAEPPSTAPSFLAEEPAPEPPVAFSDTPLDSSLFDLSDPATAAATLTQEAPSEEREGEIPGLFEEAPLAAEPEQAKAAPEETLKKEQAAPAPEKAAPSLKPAAKPEAAPAAAGIMPEVKPEQPAKKTETKPAVKPEAAAPKAEPKPAPKPAPAAAAKVEPKPAPKPAPAAAPKIEPKPAPKPAPAAAMKPEAKPAPAAKPKAAESAVPSLPVEIQEERPPAVFDASPAAPASGMGKKLLIAAVVLLVVGAAAFGLVNYFGKDSDQAPQTLSGMLSPEGLQIVNASGNFDSAKGDLVITGTVQNTTDKPKPAWYVVVDVYDAQNAVLTKARLLSGKQLYSKKDLDILARRGMTVQDLKMKSLEQGTTIPPKGSATFEIRILEAPSGIASFNPVLQPFDPVQLFKELAEEQK